MRPCDFQGCTKKHYSKGFCVAHYNQKYIYKIALRSLHSRPSKEQPICTVNSCTRPQNAKGYCHYHYQQYLKNGIPVRPKQLDLTLTTKKGVVNKGLSLYPMHHVFKKNRLVALKQNGHKCSVCGFPAKYVHHIDKTKDNHAMKNLTPVCAKCHCKLHGGGNGRPRKYPPSWGKPGSSEYMRNWRSHKKETGVLTIQK